MPLLNIVIALIVAGVRPVGTANPLQTHALIYCE
jgi:hypothetical protein